MQSRKASGSPTNSMHLRTQSWQGFAVPSVVPVFVRTLPGRKSKGSLNASERTSRCRSHGSESRGSASPKRTTGLGLADALPVRDFEPADVALGDEVYRTPRESSGWILGHYFTSNTAEARAWWEGRPRPTGRALTPPARPRTVPARPRTLPVDDYLLSSPLVTEHRGYATYDRPLPADAVREMTAEAQESYREAREQRQQRRFGDEGRRSHPPRRLVSGGGGPAQDEVYRSGWLRDVLTDLCRLPVQATGSRGSVNYYTRAGDFMGLHLDVVE